MKRAIVTVGLGFGDEGKGAAVDFLCRRHDADLVVRYSGGSQAGHNVQLPDGRRHTFSQFGAGTLAGVSTYLAAPVILHPTALVREAAHLEELGIAGPFRALTVHPHCLVSTWLHQAANQLRELARGDARHGSCGHGIGETRSYWLQQGDDAIFARDLRDPATLRAKLELHRQRLLLDLDKLVAKLPRDTLAEYDLLGLTVDGLAEPLLELGALLQLAEELPDHTTAIYEGAQGVLLDEWFGFHPYTTWSTVTAHHAIELVVRSGAEEVCVLGLTRACTTRHGAGPLPSYDEALTAAVRDEGNPWNRWQGSLRVGWLDLVLLRYAARACAPIDNLGVSCLDYLDGKDAQVSVGYDCCEELPLPPGPALEHQERLTRMLEEAVALCLPATKDSLLAMIGEIAPIALVAHGPTHLDRDCTPLRFRKRVRPTP